MYYIQGADHQEYGPVSVEQIRQWIAEDRLNGVSLCRATDQEAWRILSDFPDFTEALGSKIGTTRSGARVIPEEVPRSVSVASTYFIQGADQKQYGPVSEELLRQWIGEGRLNRSSQCKAEGSLEWKTLGNFPEFSAVLGSGLEKSSAFASAPVALDASAQVRPPAIGIIVTGAVGGLLSLAGLVMQLLGVNQDQKLPPGLPVEWEKGLQAYMEFVDKFGVVTNILVLVLSLVTVFAGVRMLQLRSYGWVLTGIFLAMIPCLSGCCCLGIPLGIWALVVINRPAIKASFD
jgi:GYF domain 2